MVQKKNLFSSNENRSPYFGRQAVLTTKHHKAKAIALPLRAGLGLEIDTADIDTDVLGTFTGEIERKGTPLETVLKKARLGMSATGAKLGIANEGSFGPHPLIPFFAGCHEIMIFIDDSLDIQVTVSLISEQTNYAHEDVKSYKELESFLNRVKFPSHALIVKPNKLAKSWLGKMPFEFSNNHAQTAIYKGIQDQGLLGDAISTCAELSLDGLAHVETDMRAHMNPTRQKVLRALAIKLARRLRATCPECDCPGFGVSGTEGNLPCEDCGYPSQSYAREILSCLKCHKKIVVLRQDGKTDVSAAFCDICNP